MFIQTDFNISKCFENLGFKKIKKDTCHHVEKDNISIFYYKHDKLSVNTGGGVDMLVFEGSKLIYHGLTPTSEESLLLLLDLLFPSSKLIEKIEMSFE
ncbi:MAG: hypothetical protein ACK5KT_13065 [Dysgonomonas sp.]